MLSKSICKDLWSFFCIWTFRRNLIQVCTKYQIISHYQNHYSCKTLIKQPSARKTEKILWKLDNCNPNPIAQC